MYRQTSSSKLACGSCCILSGAERFMGRDLFVTILTFKWMNSHIICFAHRRIDDILLIALSAIRFKTVKDSSSLITAASTDTCECTLHRPVGLFTSKNLDVYVLGCIHVVPVHTCQ